MGKWNLSSLPILPDQYEFKVASGKSEQFNAVKKLFKEADTIINACDVDREGSNIFYSIYNMTGVKNKTIKRLWINSLEVDEVRKGFENLQDNQKDLLLYNEAKTRQISDWLVGISGSRVYTLLLQQKGLKEVMSIGRVQSPTVYLIYQRQQEIEHFVPKPFYEIEGEFSAKNEKYKGKVKVKSDKREEIQGLLDQHNRQVYSCPSTRFSAPQLRHLMSIVMTSILHACVNRLQRRGMEQVLERIRKKAASRSKRINKCRLPPPQFPI